MAKLMLHLFIIVSLILAPMQMLLAMPLGSMSTPIQKELNGHYSPIDLHMNHPVYTTSNLQLEKNTAVHKLQMSTQLSSLHSNGHSAQDCDQCTQCGHCFSAVTLHAFKNITVLASHYSNHVNTHLASFIFESHYKPPRQA